MLLSSLHVKSRLVSLRDALVAGGVAFTTERRSVVRSSIEAGAQIIGMRDLSAYQQLSLTYSKPTNDSQSPSAGEDVGVDQARGVRLNKPHKAADPRQGSQIRDRRGAAIAARKRALSEWDKKNPGPVYDPELFRREILPRLA
jgi:hypothetical protein